MLRLKLDLEQYFLHILELCNSYIMQYLPTMYLPERLPTPPYPT